MTDEHPRNSTFTGNSGPMNSDTLVERRESKSPPVSMELVARKRATIILPVLNNEKYIGAQIISLLKQWRDDCELLVIDDGSSDQSFEVARQVVAAHEGVDAIFVRNPKTIGMNMIPMVLRHSSADILVEADSDDISLPGRLDAIISRFDSDPSCRLMFGNTVVLSANGFPFALTETASTDLVWRDPLDAILRRSEMHVIGASMAFHRTLLTNFPEIDSEFLPYGFDLLLPLRALLLGSVHYCAEPLVGWRQHSGNTHRLAGALESEGAGRERHGAFELMVLAQWLRDIEHLRSQILPCESERILTAWRQAFLHHFEDWSRTRNRLQRFDHSTVVTSEYNVSIPPLVGVQRGRRLQFGLLGDLGTVAETWPGIYQAEPNWNWTASSALIAFNVNLDNVDTIQLELAAGVTEAPQTIRISVNLGPFESFSIDPVKALVRMPISQGALKDCLVVLIHVPQAIRPSEVNPSTDMRLLGVRLKAIEVLCNCPAASAQLHQS